MTSILVSAPASTGNLGPGFDVLGAALSIRNELTVEPDGSGRFEIRGTGADTLAADATNLVARAFERAAPGELGGVDLLCTNRIPLARGLGSSTAAAACGLVAGWEHTGVEWIDEELCEALIEFDGHPDNAGACAYGGIVLCHDRPDVLGEAGFLDVVELGAADWLRPIVIVPDRELATADARAALPDSYDRSTVVRAIAASGLLLAGLTGGHPELIADALHTDVLHEPHRAALVPELGEVREAIAATRALGATLSGAGPAIVVWCEPDTVEQALGSLTIDFPEHHLEALAIEESGARASR